MLVAVEQLLSAGGLVVVGWLLAQLTEAVKARRELRRQQDDRRHEQLEREDAFQRDNLLRLQEAMGELSVTIGRHLSSAPAERNALWLEAKSWGRKCHTLASRVSDDKLRVSALEMSERLARYLGSPPEPRAAVDYGDAVESLAVFIEEMGARLRAPASLARADASVTSAISIVAVGLPEH